MDRDLSLAIGSNIGSIEEAVDDLWIQCYHGNTTGLLADAKTLQTLASDLILKLQPEKGQPVTGSSND